MTDTSKQTRDQLIATFRAHAAELFAAAPSRQSVMLAVAQYWNDAANDEVHAHVFASSRVTPVWPHECSYPERAPALPGEECRWCSERELEMDFYGGYGDAMVAAIEPFCIEAAHQNMDTSDAYVPYAIARRDGSVEIVAHVLRPPTMLIDSVVPAATWPDARARALFEEVCLHAADDGPRAVLSDYLLEKHPGDPRGEALALALARDLDAATRARRDELFAANVERWLFPLGDVIVAGTAHFERGFLARADVYAEHATDRDRVLNAPAWGTVHTIRFAPESRDVIGPTMHALRDVGPIRDDGLAAIARAGRPWAIETLRVGASAKLLDPLLHATTLPRLTTLEIAAVHRDFLVRRLRMAPWREQLDRLVIVDREHGSLADWRALRDAVDVRELAIVAAPSWLEVAAGWELGFRADDSVRVQCRRASGDGSLHYLVTLLDQLPATRVVLASTPARAMEEDDRAYLAERTAVSHDLQIER